MSKQPDRQFAGTLEARITRNIKLEYLLYLPDGYNRSRQRWPLMLFLHGSGERGHDLELVKSHGPPKHVQTGRSYPCIVISPQCPTGEWWDADALNALMDDLERTLRVDPDRIYVTGLSMGGYGTWELAIKYPHRFAAIAPICGGGMAFRTDRIRHLPVWAFHGALDEAVPLEHGAEMVRRLRRYGNKRVKWTVYKNVGHNAWERAYNNPKLMEWLLGQKREQATTHKPAPKKPVRIQSV
jgi:predicted peptidase